LYHRCRRKMKPTIVPPFSPCRVFLALSLLTGACADDSQAVVDAGGDLDAAVGFFRDGEADVAPGDQALDVVPDYGPAPMEPPLTIPLCPADPSPMKVCCASALGFDDGSTDHFLPSACCRLALSRPVIVSAPTACGHGALRLDAAFRATDGNSMCDQPGQAAACDYVTGEVSRPVWTSLDLTGLTVSAMVYLDGPALPSAPVHASVFVLAGDRPVDGLDVPITQTGVWTAVPLRIPDNGTAPGADIRLIGVRVAFHGQAWTGYAYIDEITWH
jgi:hypothetical protein